MAFYRSEVAPEAIREKARAEVQRAKRRAGVQRERRKGNFQDETSRPVARPAMDPGVLASMTRDELYGHAKQIGLRGRSKMNKAELIEAVRHNW